MQNENKVLWTSAFLNERFTGPVSPLGWSHVGALFEQYALRDPLRYMGYSDAETIPAARLWHAQPYVNVEIFQIFYKPFPDALVPADAVRYFPNGDVNYRKRAPYPTSTLQPRFLLSLLRHLLRDAFNASPLNYRKWLRFAAYHDAQTQMLQAQLEASRTPREILPILDALFDLDAQLLKIHRWSLTYADVFYKILAHWTGDLAPLLIRNVPNKTRAVNAQLAALAHMPVPLSAALLAQIQSDAPLNAAEQNTARALQDFLTQHGHRAFSLDIAHPTFADDPAQLLPLVQNSAAVSFAADSSELRAAYQQARRNLRWWQRAVFRPVVGLSRRYAQLREDQRYYWQKSLALTRRAYMQIGKQCAAQNVLDAPQDIFYATRAEIFDYTNNQLSPAAFHSKIVARQAEWRGYRADFVAHGTHASPHFLQGDAPLVESAASLQETVEWRGRGVSPGIARGTVRVVLEPRELGRVNAGEILVTASTDPAWTPVFARLGGLVMERGGVLSHGAVVAREYHLPAVTAVADITRLLQDGECIELDGTTGIVRRSRVA